MVAKERRSSAPREGVQSTAQCPSSVLQAASVCLKDVVKYARLGLQVCLKFDFWTEDSIIEGSTPGQR